MQEDLYQHALPVWQAIPDYLSDVIEGVQTRALRTTYPETESYTEALQLANIPGAIHSTKLSGNFGPKLNGSVLSNRKSFEKTGPPFEVVLFSRSDRLEFQLNGSRPPSPKRTMGRKLTIVWNTQRSSPLCGEERCVTTLKTAVQQTKREPGEMTFVLSTWIR